MSRALTDSSTDNKLVLATHRVSRLERRPPVGVADEPLVTIKVRVNATTAGDTTLVAAIASNRIVVISAALMANDAVDVQFRRGGANIVAGSYHLPSMGGFVLPENRSGWFQTSIGEPLLLNLSLVTVVSGVFSYITSTT
jgi:hypothetical protein